MFSFISSTPPETALLLGLSTGALIADTVKKIVRHRLRGASGLDGQK